MLFYTKIHTLRLSVGGRTNGRTDGRTENIYSIFRDKLLLRGEHVLVQNYILFMCISNLILAIHTQSMNGLKEPFKDSREMFLQPTHSGCNLSVLTWRNHRLPSPTRINLFLRLSFCLSVRAKKGIWSKQVLIRKIGNFSFSVH